MNRREGPQMIYEVHFIVPSESITRKLETVQNSPCRTVVSDVRYISIPEAVRTEKNTTPQL